MADSPAQTGPASRDAPGFGAEQVRRLQRGERVPPVSARRAESLVQTGCGRDRTHGRPHTCTSPPGIAWGEDSPPQLRVPLLRNQGSLRLRASTLHNSCPVQNWPSPRWGSTGSSSREGGCKGHAPQSLALCAARQADPKQP